MINNKVHEKYDRYTRIMIIYTMYLNGFYQRLRQYGEI